MLQNSLPIIFGIQFPQTIYCRMLEVKYSKYIAVHSFIFCNIEKPCCIQFFTHESEKKVLVAQSYLTVTPWTVTFQAPLSMDFPDKNTGVGSYSLLLGIFLTQGSNPGLLPCKKKKKSYRSHCHYCNRITMMEAKPVFSM